MITVRLASDHDIQEISRLSDQLGYRCPAEQTLQLLKELEQDHDHAVFVADIEGKGLAGYIHVFKTRRLFLDPFGELGGLVVGEESRDSGVGKALLVAAESWASEQSCREIRVRSNVIRDDARLFYLNQSYQVNKQQTVFLKTLDYQEILSPE